MILAIDVSHRIGLMSLELEDGRILSLSSDKPREHLEFLQSGLVRLEAESGLKWASLKRTAVTLGPGSFTGLRVGLATLKGLIFGTDIPLLPLSSLSIPALAAGLDTPRVVIRRARIQTYWTGFFEPGESATQEEYLLEEADLLHRLATLRTARPGLIILGDAQDALGELDLQPEPGRDRQIAALAELAKGNRGLVSDADLDLLLPRYMAEPSVTVPKGGGG